ncbi:MAG TPA: dethiobiotin synthase [Gemmataceae bacterium]|jgi:dethiobiotin synthetase
MMRGLFITATDTGAGKTFVTAGVARIWRREQRPFRVCKPVATGAEERWSEDTRLLAEAADDTDLEAVTPHTFAAPAAPPVAARLAGATVKLEDLIAAVHRRAAEGMTVLVEGVGGLLCPLTERETVADLVRELDMPLIVVARRSLGTLNHTLLTVEAARHRGLRLVGVVVTETTPIQGVAEETNVEELRRRLDVPLLAVLPHQPDSDGGVMPALQAVDWWRLAQ